MARDWEPFSTLIDIRTRMSHFGKNIAPFPLCISEELRDGKTVWIVDLHVKVYRVTEFDITSEGDTLGAALRGAYLGLNNERGLVAHAERTNGQYGVAV